MSLFDILLILIIVGLVWAVEDERRREDHRRWRERNRREYGRSHHLR